MTITKLPWGVFPDVARVGIHTYVAFSHDSGLSVYWMMSPSPVEVFSDTNWQNGDGAMFPRIQIVDGQLLVAYRKPRPSPNFLRVIKIPLMPDGSFAGEQPVVYPAMGLECWGNNPVCWDIVVPGLVSMQHNPSSTNIEDLQRRQGLYTDLLAEVGRGPAYCNGLGYNHSRNKIVVTSNDNRLSIPNMYDPSWVDTTTACGKGINGGVVIQENGRQAFLFPGQYTGDPRMARGEDGLYTVVYWAPKEIEQAITVVSGIDFAAIVEQPPVVHVEPLGQKAIGCYFASSTRYGYFSVDGNFEILFDDFNYMQRKRPVIAGTDAMNVPSDMLMGWYAATDGIRTLPEMINIIRGKANKKAFIYTDGTQFDTAILGMARVGDVVMPQCYLQLNESIQNFESRCRDEIQRLNVYKYPLLLALGSSDRGFLSDLTLQQLMPVYDRLLRLPNVIGGAFFSYGRPTGMVSHPSLVPWLGAFSGASSGLPESLKPATINPPSVGVLQWGSELTPNNYWTASIQDLNNPGQVVVVEIKNGNLRFVWKNSAGEAATGAVRHINIHS